MSEHELTSHKTNGCNKQITVKAFRRGAGGANTRYDVSGPLKYAGGSCGMVPSFGLNVRFQDGPVDQGINGITNEVLLSILEDRLLGFQGGPFAHENNEVALEHVRAAMQALIARTTEREARGVEGTHKV